MVYVPEKQHCCCTREEEKKTNNRTAPGDEEEEEAGACEPSLGNTDCRIAATENEKTAAAAAADALSLSLSLLHTSLGPAFTIVARRRRRAGLSFFDPRLCHAFTDDSCAIYIYI